VAQLVVGPQQDNPAKARRRYPRNSRNRFRGTSRMATSFRIAVPAATTYSSAFRATGTSSIHRVTECRSIAPSHSVPRETGGNSWDSRTRNSTHRHWRVRTRSSPGSGFTTGPYRTRVTARRSAWGSSSGTRSRASNRCRRTTSANCWWTGGGIHSTWPSAQM